MESNLPQSVIEFSEQNKLNGYFVNAVIETAKELKSKFDINGPLFPSMVLSDIGKRQKEMITENVDQMIKTNEDIAAEYNTPATETDFERVPAKFRNRFPADTKGWKNKDIAIFVRWLMYFDQVAQSASLLPIVDKIIKIFRPQILKN